jgi:hypothetical protein
MVEGGDNWRRDLGEAGREKATREWAWPRLVERMDDAYRVAIEHRKGAEAR